MSKYKLINQKTKEEHLCDKVTIDGFDYYVNDFITDEVDGDLSKIKIDILHKISVATNNPNIDIPKVVDEVAVFIKKTFFREDGSFKRSTIGADDIINGFKTGYNKSKETHPFTEEDMIEFAEWLGLYYQCFHKSWIKLSGNGKHENPYETQQPFFETKELLQMWKEQRTITIYYDNNRNINN